VIGYAAPQESNKEGTTVAFTEEKLQAAVTAVAALEEAAGPNRLIGRDEAAKQLARMQSMSEQTARIHIRLAIASGALIEITMFHNWEIELPVAWKRSPLYLQREVPGKTGHAIGSKAPRGGPGRRSVVTTPAHLVQVAQSLHEKGTHVD
jgi:hypothetical protein